MKISYRTHPVLQKIFDGNIGVMPIHESDYLLPFNKPLAKEISENFKANCDSFKSNIKVITKPFWDAIVSARVKMIDDNLFYSDTEESGTLIYPDGLIILYRFNPFDPRINKLGNRLLFVFDRGFMTMYERQVISADAENPLLVWVSQLLDKVYTPYLNENGIVGRDAIIGEISAIYFSQVIYTLNFIKYATVETTYLKAKGKSKDYLCKYKNDTDLPIQIMDSKWFTNLVKSDGFKVRGHFRLQLKKKDGQWTKELIWINEFQKEGYAAPARKLTSPIAHH